LTQINREQHGCKNFLKRTRTLERRKCNACNNLHGVLQGRCDKAYRLSKLEAILTGAFTSCEVHFEANI
jgi:hypothetical protein